MFWAFPSLLRWVEKLFMLFHQDHIHPHIYAIPTLGIRNRICFTFIIALWESKLPLYAILHQKETHGLQKKVKQNKRSKSSSVQKKEERERQKESSHALSKRSQRRETSQSSTTSTKYTTHMHILMNLYDLLLLWSKCLT